MLGFWNRSIPKAKATRTGPWFYTSKDLPKLIHSILSYPPCSSITVEALHRETNVKQQTIKEILSHFSHKHDEVNLEYDEAIARTNTNMFPLVDLGNGEYYLLSSQFCGYAFCEKMHAELKGELKDSFDASLGVMLEELIRQLLRGKGYAFKHGIYAEGVSGVQTDCDLVMETDRDIFFFEIKKRGLSKGFELVKDVQLLRDLGYGPLRAQVQALKHRLYLKNNSNINLVDENGNQSLLVERGRRINTISICLPEYGFLTIKSVIQKLTECMLYVNYNTYDPSEAHKLNDLNLLADEFKGLAERLDPNHTMNTRTLTFDISFKSFQQFWIALTNSTSKENFLELLRADHYMQSSSLDFYETLRWEINVKTAR